MRQLLLNILPAPVPAWENFVPGKNREALSTLQNWLDQPEATSCFFLFGADGTGKTHLLKASGLPYTDARLDPSLSNTPQDAAALAVDRVESLDAEGQARLFHHFNRLHAQGGRLLASAGQSPLHLTVREDLRTRLGYGLIYPLLPLDDEDKVLALTALAQARQLRVSNDLIVYLIRHLARDMGTLTSWLIALDRHALEHQRAMTLPLLRELLQTTVESRHETGLV